MKQKEITVLMVEPGQHPKVTTLKNDLDSLQRAVSIGAEGQGLIEIISLENGDCILCNEEGKLIGLEGNQCFVEDTKEPSPCLPVRNSRGRLQYTKT